MEGKDYYQILNWWSYQAHQFAVPSQYPKPDGWKDRIRKTLTTGNIVTCNWITANGKPSPDTCDEQGLAIHVNDHLNDHLNDHMNLQSGVQDKDKDSDSDNVQDHVEVEVSPPAALPPPKPPRVVTNPSDQQDMFGAIADACQLDAKLKQGQIAKQSKALLEAGYTPAQVRAFPAWWTAKDWRGQKGNVPTLAQLAELIKQSTTSNGTDPAKKREVNRLDRILGVDIHGNSVRNSS
jgi:hypothetical protein